MTKPGFDYFRAPSGTPISRYPSFFMQFNNQTMASMRKRIDDIPNRLSTTKVIYITGWGYSMVLKLIKLGDLVAQRDTSKRGPASPWMVDGISVRKILHAMFDDFLRANPTVAAKLEGQSILLPGVNARSMRTMLGTLNNYLTRAITELRDHAIAATPAERSELLQVAHTLSDTQARLTRQERGESTASEPGC